MATVAGGVIGAAIGWGWGGTAAAASLGWAIGSAIGSYADQPDTPDQQGPRLDSLKIQESAYGAFIKRVYGRDRVGGSLIWLANNRIDETRHEEDIGGKGGDSGTQTTYTYSASFAVAVCEGPIAGIRRIWADSVLIYDVSDGATVQQLMGSYDAGRRITIYTGTEDQEPDSLIESYLGAGNVPGYRGTAYVVFNDLQLDKYGKRIPNLTFEVLTSGTINDSLRLVSTEALSGATLEAKLVNVYTPTFTQYITFPMVRGWDGAVMDVQYNRLDRAHRFSLSGAALDVQPMGEDAANIIGALGDFLVRRAQTNLPIGQGYQFERRLNLSWYATLVQEDALEYQPFYPSGLPDGRYVAATFPSADGRMMLVTTRPGSTGFADRWHLLGDGGELLNGGAIGSPSEYLTAPANNNMGQSDSSDQRAGILDGDGGLWLTYRLIGTPPRVAVRRHEVSGSLPLTDSAQYFSSGQYSSCWFSRGVFLVFRQAETTGEIRYFTRQPALVAEPVSASGILDDLCAAAGLEPADYDNSAITDEIAGYTVQSLRALRENVSPLMPIARFDVAQIDWQLRAVKRGAAPVATITAADLAAHEYGQERPPEVTETRALEQSMPKEVIVEYNDTGNDYQRGLQRAARIGVDSKNIVDLASPIAMDADRAAQTADVMLKAAWTERNRFGDIPLPGKYSYLTPTDVVEIQATSGTYTVRITEKDDHVGLLKIKGVADRASDYTSAATGTELGYGGQEIAIQGPTLGLMLDIPILRDQDDNAGFYVAAAGYLDSWAGAVLHKSPDGGETYAAVMPLTTTAKIGTTTDALSDGVHTLIDEASSTNVRMLADQELSSVTRTALLNGQSVAAIGADDRWEIVGFQTATLEADGTYTLTNLLRGLRGTEWATGTHQVGDRFVLLANNGSIQRVMAGQSELDMERIYKFTTFGRRLAESDEVPFANEGVGITPLAPRYVRGARSGNDLTVTWYARGRIGSGFRVSQDDITGYEVDVLDGSTVVRTLSTTSTGDTASVEYTEADQITDFGSAQPSVTVRVYGIHEIKGRGYPAEATI